MSEQDNTVTQHCECGSELYHVKTTDARDEAWAECAECGRPTGVMGDGAEKQREWRAQTDG